VLNYLGPGILQSRRTHKRPAAFPLRFPRPQGASTAGYMVYVSGHAAFPMAVAPHRTPGPAIYGAPFPDSQFEKTRMAGDTRLSDGHARK
jgi:hypothetical protein